MIIRLLFETMDDLTDSGQRLTFKDPQRLRVHFKDQRPFQIEGIFKIKDVLSNKRYPLKLVVPFESKSVFSIW